jgi:hypothetical protein
VIQVDKGRSKTKLGLWIAGFSSCHQKLNCHDMSLKGLTNGPGATD